MLARAFCCELVGLIRALEVTLQTIIESFALFKSYGPTQALAGVDVKVPRGQVFGFLGPNGAGKTTFVKILLDFIRPSSGRVELLGNEPAHADRRRLGYLPERISIHPFLTAREFLEMQARLAGLPAATRSEEVARALERVKMSEAADRRIEGFSKGMLQRIGVAQAILGQPELLVLDEPNSGLDPLGVLEIREIILAEKARGATVFVNSHQLLEVEKMCDRVAILNRGRVVAQGTQGELTGKPGIEIELEEAGESVLSYLRGLDPQMRTEGRRLVVSVENSEEERLLPARLVERGARIAYYAHRRDSLEAIFKRVVGEST